MTQEHHDLNELMKKTAPLSKKVKMALKEYGYDLAPTPDNSDAEPGDLIQWTTSDSKVFIPASHTQKKIPPGVYEIDRNNQIGVFFRKIPVKTEGIIRFPQTNSETIIQEIQTFWDKEAEYREFGITYKRGMMLYGPPGSGKSSLLQWIMKDVMARDGIVIKFTYPELFLQGMRLFRDIEPNTPTVVLMEDIDSIIERYNSESEVLNILDGVDRAEKLLFLATTNYPERLGPRIMNRPSRFDKRFKIDHPNEESRKIYFKHLIGDRTINIDIDQWVKDTEKFSIAHLKELFVAVVILGSNYDETIIALRSMKEDLSSEDDRDKMGFFNLAQNSKSYNR